MPLSTVLGAQSLVQPAVCTTATRPASPYTGQAIYDTTVSQVLVYNGTAFVAVGPPQIKSTTLLTTFTSTSATFTGITGLTVSITPQSTSSKVLVIAQIAFGMSIASGYGHFKLSGGNSGNYIGDSPGSRIAAVFGGYASADQQESVNMGTIVFLDSPATTSSTTYGVSVRTASAGSVHINRAGADSNDNSKTRGASSITVFEVLA